MTRKLPELPCVPPEMQAKAAEAEQRKEAAVERLHKLGGEAPPVEPDDFEIGMRALIDADKKVVELKARRRPP